MTTAARLLAELRAERAAFAEIAESDPDLARRTTAERYERMSRLTRLVLEDVKMGAIDDDLDGPTDAEAKEIMVEWFERVILGTMPELGTIYGLTLSGVSGKIDKLFERTSPDEKFRAMAETIRLYDGGPARKKGR